MSEDRNREWSPRTDEALRRVEWPQNRMVPAETWEAILRERGPHEEDEAALGLLAGSGRQPHVGHGQGCHRIEILMENVDTALLLLTTLCPPPAHPALSRATEGITIPTSHNALIRTYGTGCFDEFVWIFAENAQSVQVDITERTRELRTILRSKEMITIRHDLGDHQLQVDDLVQWGVTDNADVLAWITRGEPEEWPTAIIQAGQLRSVVSPRSSTATILDLLTRSTVVPFFPPDFPGDQPEFLTNPYS
ncbi:hypothetical protein [Streptomyces sp. NPDC091294]|uniref:hypothetical protein n=1 Tax=Streptomyces sp. NPDC091294 TaxID=3365992 RepID=UPI003817E1C7